MLVAGLAPPLLAVTVMAPLAGVVVASAAMLRLTVVAEVGLVGLNEQAAPANVEQLKDSACENPF